MCKWLFAFTAAASDRICNLEEHVCLSNAARKNSLNHLFLNWSFLLIWCLVFYKLDEFKDDPFPEECLCLPRCHETWYSTELSVGTIPGEGFLHSNISESVTKNPMNLSKIMLKEYYRCEDHIRCHHKFQFHFNLFLCRNNVAILNVYYNKPVGYVYQTDIAFKWQDLICKFTLAQTYG